MIASLFEGRMKSYIRCVNIEYESSRLELFYDIQLVVKGMKTLQDSFKDYIAEETLSGDNKYMAEGHGLQVGATFAQPSYGVWLNGAYYSQCRRRKKGLSSPDCHQCSICS